jgi:hypothetical protein
METPRRNAPQGQAKPCPLYNPTTRPASSYRPNDLVAPLGDVPSSVIVFALHLPGGISQALGLRSMGQLSEPSWDPEDPARLLLEMIQGVE